MHAVAPPQDARATTPILNPRHERLPERCRRCGSRLLDREDQGYGVAVGSLECVSCGEVLCYLQVNGPDPIHVALPLLRRPTMDGGFHWIDPSDDEETL